jgi:DNA modification methylase
VVLDPFCGSNTTGAVAEQIGRRWIAIEKDCAYLADSELRFGAIDGEQGNEERTLFDLTASR